MVEKYENRVHTEHVVLDIGQDIGSLVIYTREELRGYQIDVSLKAHELRNEPGESELQRKKMKILQKGGSWPGKRREGSNKSIHEEK